MLELLVAMALLATATVGIGKFISATTEGLQARELSARIGWELDNARERIGAWADSELTEQQIENLPFSEALTGQLDNLHWSATVTPTAQPAQTKRVHLTIECQLFDQTARPDSLTFWVASVDAAEGDVP